MPDTFGPEARTDNVKLQFLGATEQVTGSQYYVEAGGAKLLVDCGMHQERAFLSRNWDPSPINLRTLDAILLTHAHVDHCGLAPKLVREGFRGPIRTTSASADLVALVLRDAAAIQEEDAAFKRKRHRREGRRGKYPVKPLYSLEDVERTLPLLNTTPYGKPVRLTDRLQAVFHDAGHILGSAMIELQLKDDERQRRIVFTGDLGQWNKPIVRDPTVFDSVDYLILESTYGDRLHENHETVESQLERVIAETVAAQGKLIIPIFAIERAQELLYYLNRLLYAGRMPPLPVFLDSPMAADVTEVFRRHRECFDDEAMRIIAAGEHLMRFPTLKVLRTTSESMALNTLPGAAIIMATSGMCTAGRIKHHLAHHLGDPACIVLFVGYQAVGTLGRQILDGQEEVRIHGAFHRVRAKIRQIHGISGHADQAGLLDWLSHLREPPRRLFLTHGEPQAVTALAQAVKERFSWPSSIPQYRETVTLD